MSVFLFAALLVWFMAMAIVFLILVMTWERVGGGSGCCCKGGGGGEASGSSHAQSSAAAVQDGTTTVAGLDKNVGKANAIAALSKLAKPLPRRARLVASSVKNTSRVADDSDPTPAPPPSSTVEPPMNTPAATADDDETASSVALISTSAPEIVSESPSVSIVVHPPPPDASDIKAVTPSMDASDSTSPSLPGTFASADVPAEAVATPLPADVPAPVLLPSPSLPSMSISVSVSPAVASQEKSTLRAHEWKLKYYRSELEHVLRTSFPDGILLGSEPLKGRLTETTTRKSAADKTNGGAVVAEPSVTLHLKTADDVQAVLETADHTENGLLTRALLTTVLNVERLKHIGLDSYRLKNLPDHLALFNGSSVAQVVDAAHARLGSCGCPKLIALPLCSASAYLLVRLLEYINQNYAKDPTQKPLDLGYLIAPLTLLAAAAL